ncbi:MAG: class I SAM-dependent methyltransferase [Candidatus Cloacimonas sp.]|jgi:ubiquinone/menaquinone biosynthesis C-methylase UbiE|nr:class I SAM-dependent methyltransferase [Candidatus Cloacimonas sp.]
MTEIIKILSQIDGGMVLDAATGRGEFITTLKKYLKSYTQIIGVDASERSVDYAQKLFPENDVEIFRMNLEDLQFDDNYFDVVCTSNSLHHLEHIEIVFSELQRVLKPGGLLIVTEMYCDGEQTPAQETHIMMHHWLAKVDRMNGIYHQSTFTKVEIEQLVKALPLKKLEIVDFYIPVDNPYKNCETLMDNCRETQKRLENMPGSEDLLAEGKALLARLKDVGCASASRLLITSYKNKEKKVASAAKIAKPQKGDK